MTRPGAAGRVQHMAGLVSLALLLVPGAVAAAGLLLRGRDVGVGVQQVHLAQGKDPSVMVVSWLTTDRKAPTVVRYGLSPESLSVEVRGNDTVWYRFLDPRFPPYESGLLHHVPLTGLQPATTYFYSVGETVTADGPAGVYSFTTLPAVGSRSRMVLGVLADLGQTADSRSTIEHLLQDTEAMMLLHAGDAGYADCEQTRWDSFMVLMEPLATRLPWMVSPGNHEVEWSAAQSDHVFLAFESRFRMPWVAPPLLEGRPPYPGHHNAAGDCTPSVYQAPYDYGNAYFSFEAGMAHVIFLNTYSYTNTTSRQYKWLESDLQSVDRKRTPWVLVLMHCPWYSSDKSHLDEPHTMAMRADMEPLLYKYGVNAVMAGHVHAYERSRPVVEGRAPVTDGIVYFNIGDAGNREGHASLYYDPAPVWSAFRNGTQFGHAVLTLESEERLTWEWHRNVDGEYVVRDRVALCNVALGLPADCSSTTQR